MFNPRLELPVNRCGVVPVLLAAVAALMTPLCVSGCRTAASMGLPVSAGGHMLLPHAGQVRAKVGHPKNMATELAKAAIPPHRLEAGDVLVIEPNDFNSPIRLQSDQTVGQDGMIELGDYGRVMVAGLTTTQVQNMVQTRVASRETARRQTRIAQTEVTQASHVEGGLPNEVPADYGLSVRLVSKENGHYYVMGEVNAPGSYALVGAETVLDAIIAAGGLSDGANEHQIILTRPQLDGRPRQILPVCYQQILQLGDVSTNYQLLPGDRLYVPSFTLWEDVKQSVAFRSDKGCPHCRSYSQ